MKYKCVECDFTFESKSKNILNKEAREHLFYNEHHGFIKIEK